MERREVIVKVEGEEVEAGMLTGSISLPGRVGLVKVRDGSGGSDGPDLPIGAGVSRDEEDG